VVDPRGVGEDAPIAGGVSRLLDDAGVPHTRTNRRGDKYSLADASIDEFVRWFDMPWE